MEPLILTASLGGRWISKKDSPYFPSYTDEIIAEGIFSYKKGIHQLHVHAHDDTGHYTYDPEIFGGILDTFRTLCPNVILQMSAGGLFDKEDLLIPLLKLNADVTTLVLQPSKEKNIELLKLYDEYGANPIVECTSFTELKNAYQLFEEGYFKAPLRIEIEFTNLNKLSFGELAAELLECAALCASRKDIVWSCCNGNEYQIPLHAMAIALGGHVRGGFEDRLKDSSGAFYKTCVDALSAELELAVKMNRAFADIPQARKILGL